MPMSKTKFSFFCWHQRGIESVNFKCEVGLEWILLNLEECGAVHVQMRNSIPLNDVKLKVQITVYNLNWM